jgi:hypothetical protein
MSVAATEEQHATLSEKEGAFGFQGSDDDERGGVDGGFGCGHRAGLCG